MDRKFFEELGIETDFMSDDELEELFGFIDGEMIQSFKEALDKSNEKTWIINKDALQRLSFVIKELKRIVNGDKIKIHTTMHSIIKSVCSINVIGENIVITDTNAFLSVFNLIPNLDIYPLTDGRVRMDFTIHDLFVSVEEEN